MKNVIISTVVILIIVCTSVCIILYNRNNNKNNDGGIIDNTNIIDNSNYIVDESNAFEDSDYESKSYASSLSSEQKIEILGLNFEDKNYAKIYEWGNTYICHVNDDCTKLIIDNQIIENDIHSMPNEIPIIFDTSEGYDASNNKLYGNIKSFKQGYLLTDANVLYEGKFDFSNADGNAKKRSYVYKFQRESRKDEQPNEISVVLYTVDRQTVDTAFLDEMDIYVKQKDGHIYIPGYTNLSEEDILNSATLGQKLYGVYQNDGKYYYVSPVFLGGTKIIDDSNNTASFYIDYNSNLLKFEDSQYAYGLYVIDDKNTKIKVVKRDGGIIVLNKIDVDNKFFEEHKPTDFSALYSFEFLQKNLNKEIY